MPTRLIFIGLGSNQGDRSGHLGRAIEALHGRGLGTLLVSSLYRTDPVEVIDQEEFLNQVVGCETALSPEQILEVCLLAEQSMGRQRTRDKGPRRIDLVPLVEIAPAAWHPVLRTTAAELLRICPDRSRVERLDAPARESEE